MALLLTEEQTQLAKTVDELVQETFDSSRVREVHENGAGIDASAWRSLVEMGVTATLVDENLGGLGFGYTEASLVLEHVGARLAPVPLQSALLGSAALSLSEDSEAKKELMPKIADGTSLLVVAATENARTWLPTEPGVVFDGQTVSGVKSFVRDGRHADQLLVVASQNGERVIVLVDAKGKGVTTTTLGTLDRSMSAARIEFSSAPARRIDVGDTDAYCVKLDYIAGLLLAASQYGAFHRAFDITVQYAKDRVQFGRSIGSFQGVKHPLAEWAMELELSYAILRNATQLVDAGDSGARVAALTAQVKMQSLVYSGGSWMARLHGGIGYTWEHDAHLYLKNAKASQVILGTPGARTEILAEALGL